MRLFLLPLLLATLAQAQPLQIGVAHVSGTYHLTSQHYLDEGAEDIAQLGAKCIKVYLTLDTDRPVSAVYAHGSEWPACRTLAELAASPPFQRLFARPFETYVMTTFRGGRSASYWRAKFTEEDAADERRFMLATLRGLAIQSMLSGEAASPEPILARLRADRARFFDEHLKSTDPDL